MHGAERSPLISLYPTCTSWLSDINHRVIKWTTRRKAGSHGLQNSQLHYRPPLMLLFPLWSAAQIWVTAHISAAVSPTDNIWVLGSLFNIIQKQSSYWYISIYYISASSSYHIIINPVSSSKNKRIMNANAKHLLRQVSIATGLLPLFCLFPTPGVIPTGLIWTSLHPLMSSCFRQ